MGKEWITKTALETFEGDSVHYLDYDDSSYIYQIIKLCTLNIGSI